VALKYQRGTIVIVSQVPDQNGVNPKDRPVVIVRDYDATDRVAFGVAVTGEYDHPLPGTSILLPYHRQGRCKTGLKKPSVAACTWIVVAASADILDQIGFTPAVELAAILQQVQAHLPTVSSQAPPSPPPASPPTATDES
jgi:mRNA-degrading endonuclease toxin of MazEF toxin-antitoxin module